MNGEGERTSDSPDASLVEIKQENGGEKVCSQTSMEKVKKKSITHPHAELSMP